MKTPKDFYIDWQIRRSHKDRKPWGLSEALWFTFWVHIIFIAPFVALVLVGHYLHK